MNQDEELVRAGKAKELLDNPIFVEAQRKIEEGLLSQMGSVGVRDTDMHTRLILTLQLWNTLKNYIQSEIETGKMVQFQLEQQKMREKRAWDMFSRIRSNGFPV